MSAPNTRMAASFNSSVISSPNSWESVPEAGADRRHRNPGGERGEKEVGVDHGGQGVDKESHGEGVQRLVAGGEVQQPHLFKAQHDPGHGDPDNYPEHELAGDEEKSCPRPADHREQHHHDRQREPVVYPALDVEQVP